MPKRSSKDQGVNQLAADIAARTSREDSDEKPAKNPAAVALGRLGGLKGGKARAAKLPVERRREIAKAAAEARWAAGRKENG